MKIAIVRLSALGDIIQSSIVLQFIKKRKNVKIDWIVDENFAELLRYQEDINELYALPLKKKDFKKSLAILLEARQNSYDFIIDLQGLIKSSIVARILGDQVFGYAKGGIKESLACYLYSYKFPISYEENIIVRNIALAAFAINESFDYFDILSKKDCFSVDMALKAQLEESLNLAENKKNILIHVGSSVANKIYPKERLALLARKILNAFDAKIFLCWGNKAEFDFAKDVIAGHLEHEKIELCPRLSLAELLSITKAMDLIIGNDSGPTHLAWALNKPSITIFGATPANRNCYNTNINLSISSGKKISAKQLDKSDFCITQIDEEAIFELVCKLL